METSNIIEEDGFDADASAYVEQSDFSKAVSDYRSGFLNWRLWTYMAYADIRRRYRRTIIGPFWATLSLAIFITSMGLLFSILWHTNIKVYLPYFASGYIAWSFISNTITDSCTTFVAQEGLLKQIALPYASFAWLIVARSFMVFLHQIIIFIVIALLFHVSVTRYTLLIVPGFLLLFLSFSWFAILLGLFCARFRDLQQIVMSLLQISMFVTPIFWSPSRLGHGRWAHLIVNANPLYHYVSILREPLQGKPPEALSWIVVTAITVLGWLFTMYIFSKKYRKLVFWL